MVTATRLYVGFGLPQEQAARAHDPPPHSTDLAAARREADDATRLRPDSIRAWYAAARVAARGEALTDVDAALDRALHGLDRSPRDPALRVIYGELLTERAARSLLPADITLARRELTRLVRDAPHDPRLRKALVSARLLDPDGKP
jgi:hypothetical protein